MYKKILLLIVLFICVTGSIYGANSSYTEELSDELKLNELVGELEKYTDDLDLEKITDDLINGNGINYDNFGKNVLKIFGQSITSCIKDSIFILIFLVILSIIKSLELEKDSSITKAANIVATLVIISTLLTTYTSVLEQMTQAVKNEIGIVQVASPFLMGILILTGAITTTGLIEPLILLLVSLMGFFVNYVITPLITISVIFNIITNLSDAVNLSKFSNITNKTALWINGIFLAVFLAITGIQTTVSTSLDSVTIKTTQAAVSGVIPVVRKVCIRQR